MWGFRHFCGCLDQRARASIRHHVQFETTVGSGADCSLHAGCDSDARPGGHACVSSNTGESRVLELAPARSRERQRRGACWRHESGDRQAPSAAPSAPASHPISCQSGTPSRSATTAGRPTTRRVSRVARSGAQPVARLRPALLQPRLAGLLTGTCAPSPPTASALAARQSVGDALNPVVDLA
jgi:hypothetical protein